MNKHLSFFRLLLAGILFLTGKPGATCQTFNQTYPNGGGIQATFATPVTGGYSVKGNTQPQSINSSFLSLQTDANGNQTSVSIVPVSNPTQSYVAATADGNFVFTGVSNNKATLTKKTPAGTVLWTKEYVIPNSLIVTVPKVIVSAAGAFFLIGSEINDSNIGPPYGRLYVVKTNSSGNSLWVKKVTLGNTDDDINLFTQFEQPTPNGGILIPVTAGFSETRFLVRLDGTGNVTINQQVAQGLVQYTAAAEGTGGKSALAYVATGPSGPVDVSGILNSYDDAGGLLWTLSTNQYLYDQPLPFIKIVRIGALAATTDGGYILAGTRSANQVPETFFMMKVNAAGAVVWAKYNYNFTALPAFIALSADGGYLVAGLRDGLTWLMKTDANGNQSDPPPLTCTGNLLSNPGFENGLTGWNTTGNVSLSTAANSGTKAAKVGGGGYSTVGQTLPTTPGSSYTLKGWAKASGNGYKVLELRFLNSSWATLPGSVQSQVTSSTYTEHTLTNTAPAGASYVYVIATKDGSGSMEVDDWCLTTGGGTPCNISATVINVECNDEGTPTNPADDTYAFSLLVNGGNGISGGWTVNNSQPHSYNFPYGIPGNLISGGGQTLLVADELNPACNVNVSVAPPAACSPCSTNDLNVSYTVQCLNANTPNNPADDLFTIYLTVTGGNGGGWRGFDNMPISNIYNAPAEIGTFDISNGAVTLLVRENNNPCGVEVTVPPPAPCSGGGGGNGQIDLSLALLQTPVAPAQWSNYTVKSTVSNAGPQTATGVKVKFAKPAGVVYTGGNEFTASQGSFAPFGNEEWNVGSIPANGSATLTVSYFLLQAQAPVAYAQIIAHTQTDSDSQPNNGTPPTLNQDDEASTAGGGSSNLPDLTFNGGQISPATVQVGSSFDLNYIVKNMGNAAANGFEVNYVFSTDAVYSPATDGSLGAIAPLALAAGQSSPIYQQVTIPQGTAPGTYYVILVADPGNSLPESNDGNNALPILLIIVPDSGIHPDLLWASWNVTPIACPGCLFSAFGTQENVGNGMAAASVTQIYLSSLPDEISLDAILLTTEGVPALLSGEGYQPSFNGSLPANLAEGTYWVIAIADANNSSDESDENNNFATNPIIVSNGGSGNPDLMLEVNTFSTQVSIYTIFTVTVRVRNEGTNAATGIKVHVPKPNGVVYQGGNEFTIDQGTFAPFGNQVWNVGDLPAQSQAILSINYFLLTNAPITHYAQVTAQNEQDADSTPNNGTPPTPNEDDESAVAVNNLGGGIGSNALLIPDDRFRITFDKFYPNPASHWLNVVLFSPKEQAVTLDFYSQQGLRVHTLEVMLEEGRNTLELPVSDWKSGAYNVIARGEGLPAYGRFLKVWEE